MQKHTPGEVKVLWRKNDGTAVRLANFSIAKYNLKQEHVTGLCLQVVPILASGGSALIIGLTSRSGSYAFNMKLSRDRADAVATELKRLLGFLPTFAFEFPAGELAATLAGVPDGMEHPNWRSVIILCSKQRKPPPLPVPMPRVPALVERYATKSVLYQMAPDGGGDEAHYANVGDLVYASLNPDSRVRLGKKVVVLDTFVVTRIETTLDSLGLAGSPGGQQNRLVLNFSWGTPRGAVEIWAPHSHDPTSRTRPSEIVSLSRAMDIYERPGHLVFRPWSLKK